ncbi:MULTISPECIES: M23 family metallopeptidase [unclassified Fibrobacter]|uniref:M23 family metallopeptidase n=1 Tax=unclassified Fibrobacter TaxID=2634177 RepID=UPI000D6BA065|nr:MULTISPECIES: M23 family metallopeptidase [unclassified Fibrobacter]PWJ71859.1 peptidase M23-like protein [Fibrobacter sp. UWR4]PZW73774.1 peptidase M23-like protein [Fibrobacter sp. UWR1]
MNFVKTTIHFQNSSKSMTLHVPAFLFSTWPVARIFVAIGALLFLAQMAFTTVYDGVLNLQLNERQKLEKEIAGIQGTLDYLHYTSSDFFRDENLLFSRFGLPSQDEDTRKFGTGGDISPEDMLQRKIAPVFQHVAGLNESSVQIQGKLASSEASFVNLNKYMEQKLAQWRYVPSVSPTTGRYASAFGPRIHPVTGEVGKMHQGVDIANDRWTPIFAPSDGVVEIAQPSATFGNFVTIDHGNGIKTRYGHMQRSIVRPGQFVSRYQVIGYMGNTGRSVGPHLHYEVWVNNSPVNPLAYILPNDHSVD